MDMLFISNCLFVTVYLLANYFFDKEEYNKMLKHICIWMLNFCYTMHELILKAREIARSEVYQYFWIIWIEKVLSIKLLSLPNEVKYFAIFTLPVPFISKSCIEIKINLNFYFHHKECGASEGFMKACKAFIKSLEAPQRSVKIKT